MADGCGESIEVFLRTAVWSAGGLLLVGLIYFGFHVAGDIQWIQSLIR
jgi:hypothetical protein